MRKITTYCSLGLLLAFTVSLTNVSASDVTAPDFPLVDEVFSNTSEKTYSIKGSGEAGAQIFLYAEDTGESVDSEGRFEIEVSLTGGGVTDIFIISLVDEAGNESIGAKVYVTSSSTDISEINEFYFSDIEGHWAENYIKALAARGIADGYEDGRFGPDDLITRAQVLKLSLLTISTGDLTEAVVEALAAGSEAKNFTDVSEDAWYASYVEAGSILGVIEGYSDDTFRPDDPIDRAAALKIFLKTAGFTNLSDISPNFSDVTSSDWFAIYTAFAKENGVVSGYSDGSFRGSQNMTRAEASKIMLLVDLLES